MAFGIQKRILRRIIRDALTYVLFATGVALFRLWLLKRRGPLVRVLAFHDVPAKDAQHFRKLIAFLNERHTIISPNDFANQNFKEGGVNILLTFDDGYASWSETVVPVLKEFDLSAVFFISSGFVNTFGDEESEQEFCRKNLGLKHHKRPLSWSKIERLPGRIALGGHTRTHHNLAELDDLELSREIGEDKRILEKMSGKEIHYFAYPYGKDEDISSKALEHVKKAGYHYAFTTDVNFVDFAKSNLLIPRTMIDPDISFVLLRLWVHGVYDIVRSVYEKRFTK